MTYLFTLLALAGVALVAWGLWLVYPPLALVLGGVALVYAARVGDRLWGS